MSVYALEFELEGLPPTPNRQHGHWRSVRREQRDWTDRVVLAVIKRKRPPSPLQSAGIHLIRRSHSGGRIDPDNLLASFRPVFNGLVLAKVLFDDSVQVIGWPLCEWQQAPPGRGSIRVHVWDVSQPLNPPV